MHENVTHNRDYKTFGEFRREVIKFLRHTVAQTLEAVLRSNHGQFPHHSPRRFSSYRLAAVEQGNIFAIAAETGSWRVRSRSMETIVKWTIWNSESASLCAFEPRWIARVCVGCR